MQATAPQGDVAAGRQHPGPRPRVGGVPRLQPDAAGVLVQP
jgi:hypothetical protein